jgi:subtilisin family serine protease
MERNHNLGAKDRSQGDKNASGKGYLVVKYGPLATIILVLVVAVAVLWSRRSVPGVSCKTTPEGLGLLSVRGPNESQFFVDQQVIVTGPSSKVDDVVDGYNQDARYGDLVPIRQCNLPYLLELPDPEDAGLDYFPFPKGVLGELMTMRLYYIPPGRSVGEVVQDINQAGQGDVFADPNLLVGHSACGSPHSSEGSPYGGTPKPLPVGEEEAVKLFWEQWAFRHTRVGPLLKDELAGATIMHQGEGVIVGVFDTSPFADAEDGWETVKWVNPTMDVEPLALKVSYPEVVNTIEFTPSNGSAETDSEVPDDVRDHGLFVAGLIHAVAPTSELRLIRVLNEDGCGDLFMLNEALEQFTAQMTQERGTLEGVVINLSLGVREPEGVVIPDTCGQEAPEPQVDLEDEIESLCTALSIAYDDGAVIVAAAGNRPYSEAEAGTEPDNGNEPRQAQIPAAYEFVIGVRASNVYSKSACFSYDGDVFAPGGEGDVDRDCAPNVDGCSGDCASAVIGPVLFPPETDAYWPTHYAYWSGTSFSTPLVSGLAALVRQAGLAQADEGTVQASAWQDPDLVAHIIHCGAASGSNGAVPESDGVINVPHTLIGCMR